MSELRGEPRPAGRVLDARLHLLSRQVADVTGEPVATVADLELLAVDGAEPHGGDQTVLVTALLSGAALATRVLGGHPPSSRWHRIDWDDVSDVGVAVRLGVGSDELEVTWVERWVRDHVIGRIPGGRHDPE